MDNEVEFQDISTGELKYALNKNTIYLVEILDEIRNNLNIEINLICNIVINQDQLERISEITTAYLNSNKNRDNKKIRKEITDFHSNIIKLIKDKQPVRVIGELNQYL